jgi:hypothetical protein
MGGPQQKATLKKHIQRIDVRRDEFAGIVITFRVRVGVPAIMHQMDEYPATESKPTSRKGDNGHCSGFEW